MDAFIPGLLLTVVGLGVVFGSLIVLMVIIMLLERFFGSRSEETGTGTHEQKSSPQSDDLEIVLAAAAGYFLETETPEIYVPPVRRNADSFWARTARQGRLSHRRRQ